MKQAPLAAERTTQADPYCSRSLRLAPSRKLELEVLQKVAPLERLNLSFNGSSSFGFGRGV